MKPHKWAKEIKAWADGAEIEVKDEKSDWWTTPDPNWSLHPNVEYRIKPQQQQSSCCKCQQTCSALKEPQYLYVYKEPKSDAIGVKPQVFITTEKGLYFGAEPIGKIKLEQDDVDSV